MNEETITTEQLAPMEKLFGENCLPIQTDEDYQILGEIFCEDK
jgi:hypothetical protein